MSYCAKHRTSQKPSILKKCCVFDQALYVKTAEVIWKQPQQFSHIVLRLSVLHTICSLLAVIGKRFGDAGLRDVAIEFDIIAEGSVGSVVDGKQYNRVVRLHKIIYEALKEDHVGRIPFMARGQSP